MTRKNKKRIQVPPEAAQALQIAQNKANQLSAELNFLRILVQGYTSSLKLEPGKKYVFTENGGKMYAEEVEAQ